MRVRYCCTSARDVMRPLASAFCMSAMPASTTVNAGRGADFSAAVAATADSSPASRQHSAADFISWRSNFDAEQFRRVARQHRDLLLIRKRFRRHDVIDRMLVPRNRVIGANDDLARADLRGEM